MIALTINFEGDGALEGIKIEAEANKIEALILDGGMSSGRPSVTFHFEADGKHYVAQTSGRLFCLAARAVMAKYPDLFEGD